MNNSPDLAVGLPETVKNVPISMPGVLRLYWPGIILGCGPAELPPPGGKIAPQRIPPLMHTPLLGRLALLFFLCPVTFQ
ncbi:hypothetical protein [Bacillus marinisedimentorum]|uniref:hypothetical protein n=1 Tax=Bacillus marinisedimentorum TaxID=1821260 RepID=UPI001B80A22C|nr:hypothetical protein [Bacillus marinisedimentorum]